MAKRIASYETLVEQAAENLDAWRKLQTVHAIKAKGGTPEIRWSKRGGFTVVDTTDAEPAQRQSLAG